MTTPYVTAACLAYGTQSYIDYWLPRVIWCHQQQTYGSTELWIVHDCRDFAAWRLKRQWWGQYVEFARVDQSSTVGEKRNIILNTSFDEWCPDIEIQPDARIQFDADDYHAPDRISAQVEASQEGTMAVTLQRQIRYDFETNCALIHDAGTQTGIHGTLLHPVTEYRYPDTNENEDTAFLENFRNRLVVLDNDPRLYVRFSHGNNISSRQHIMGPLVDKRDVWNLPTDMVEYLVDVLDSYTNEPLPSKRNGNG